MLDFGLEKATLAAGCFWGVQFYFDQVPGIITSRVGYTGGQLVNPSFQAVSAQNTGHCHAIEVEFDPDLITYDTLLKHFFKIHDPTQANGQGEYIGNQYRSAIFYHNDDQKVMAQIVLDAVKGHYKSPIVTSLEAVGVFYEAELENQKYTQTTGIGMYHIPYENLG